MRIISGRYRGRRLKGPTGEGLRPTSDRVKESIFNILADRLSGARVMDMFAGTGNLGLEALSRDAASAIFIDSSPRSLRVLHDNLSMVGPSVPAKVMTGDALRAVETLARRGERFDLVFVDPPYHQGLADRALQALSGAGIVAPGGVIVVECAAKEPAPGGHGFCLFRTAAYGDTVVYFFAADSSAE